MNVMHNSFSSRWKLKILQPSVLELDLLEYSTIKIHYYYWKVNGFSDVIADCVLVGRRKLVGRNSETINSWTEKLHAKKGNFWVTLSIERI